MKYYRVKKDSDQKQVYVKRSISGQWRLTATLIANELFTPRELTTRLGLQLTVQVNFIANNFDIVEVSRKQTYFCFGCRVGKIGTKYNNVTI